MPPYMFLSTSPRLAALALTVILASRALAAPTVYVDAAADFSPASPADGATVTWKSGTADEVSGLTFGTDAFTSIRSAVTAVDVDGSIHIAAGTYNEGAQINISKSLSIEGDKGAPTVLSGNNERRIFSISGASNSVSIYNLSIVDGFHRPASGNAHGGAIINSGSTLELMNCTVSNNTAHGASFGGGAYGGAISNQSGGRVTLINSTLSGNTCIRVNTPSSGQNIATGGAISSISSRLEIIHSTITNNLANEVGGLSISRGFVSFTNSIVAGNETGNSRTSKDYWSFEPSLTIRGVNFIGAGLSARTGVMTFGSTGTSIGDVLNTTLADNGGPTLTHALVQGSPSIGSGDNTSIPEGLTTDQRGPGFDRISKDTVDIGAVEFGRPIAISSFVTEPQTLALTNLPSLIVYFNQPVIKTTSGMAYLRIKHGGSEEIVPIPGNGDFQNDLVAFVNLSSIPLPRNAEVTLCFAEGLVTNIHGDSFELIESPIFFTSQFDQVYLDKEENFLITQKAGSDPNFPEAGDRVTWKPGTADAVENLIFGANAFFGTGRFGTLNSIHDALDLAHPGGTIFFPSGTFYNGESLNLTKSLTLQGDGATKSFLSGGSDGDVFQHPSSECRVISVVGAGVQAVINDLAIIDGIDAQSGRFNYGGGLQVVATASATVKNCVFAGNYSKAGGGAIFVDPNSSLTVINSTFSENASESPGGALAIRGSATFINSTVSGSSALSSGGGISVRSGGILTMHHCTVTDNAAGAALASVGGGGISVEGSATLNNTLVAGNTSVTTGTDLSGTFTSTGVNFIGDLSGATAIGSGTNLTFANTPATTIAEVIAPLVNIGGQTQVHPLAPASPAIDAGSNATIPADAFDIDGDNDLAETLPLDQTGFVRLAGSAVDIGAVEFVPAPTILSATITDGETNFNITSSLSFTFDQNVLIDTDAIQLRLASDGSIIPVSIVHNGDTLTITPSAALAEGTSYFLDFGSQTVSNLAGTSYFYGFTQLDFSTHKVNVYVDAPGDFSPANPANGATVTWKPGTVNAVNGLTFGTTAFATIQSAVDAIDDGGTVHVANGTYTEGAKIDIAKSLTLQGDGAPSTILSGSDVHPVIETTGALNDIVIQGFAITRGFSEGENSGGAGIRCQSNLTINDCAIHNNLARNGGGGIYHASQTTTLTINRCTLSNNTASNDPISAAGIGGAILNLGTLVINNSTLSGNYARNDGGAINSQTSSAVVVINHSTIVANNSDDIVGGVYFTGGSVTLNNSIVAGNTANSGADLRTGLASTFQGVNFIGNITNLASFRPGTDLTFEAGQTLADLLVTTLSNNGGPTLTHALVDGSPAIDGGADSTIPADLTTDQRGVSRIIEGAVDIGAFELGPNVFFVHQLAGDFTITTDQGNPGLDTGDIVTWNGTSLGSPVPDLIFGTDAFLSVRNAVAFARDNATIHVAAGIYQDGTQIDISKNVTLQGDGAAMTRISGSESHRVIRVFTGASANLYDLSVVDGRANVLQGGAGIFSNGTLVLRDAAVTGNWVTVSSGQGGGIYQFGGTLTINRSLIADNTAGINPSSPGGPRGGGIYVESAQTRIGNSTVSSNRLIGPNSASIGQGFGTGICAHIGNIEVAQCTITGNTGGANGGAISFSGSGTKTVINSILAGNPVVFGGDVADAFTSQGVNFVGNTTGTSSFRAGTDLSFASTGTTLADLLSPTLADNAGPTRTHALVPGSPALNAANNALIPVDLTTDQRGYPRILDGTVDIGAVEFTPAFVLPDTELAMDPGLSGKIRISDLLASITGGGGLPLTLVSFTQPGHPGSVVRISGGFLVYQSASGQTLADSFTYTFTDGIQTHTGTITVELDGVGEALTFNITSLEVAGGTATIRVAGIPGVAYQIESSETMASASWNVMGDSQVCPPAGIMTFIDPGPLPSGRFYRAVRTSSND